MCEAEPTNSVSEIYFYLLKYEKDKNIINLLDNPENVRKVNSAMTKVWENKKTDEEI